jgi:4-hydroxybenzoate polyprenyltransferase
MTPLLERRIQPDPAGESDAGVPLAIDLDGTLIRSDLLHESLTQLLAAHPWSVVSMPNWLISGKARFKREIAIRTRIDPAHLPYDLELLRWIAEQRSIGRRIVLCTASDATLAKQVAEHLGVFDEVMASDGALNLASSRKAEALVERFGFERFDYAGNSFADVAVWKACRRAVVVNASPGVRTSAAAVATVEHVFPGPQGSLPSWLKALRLRQWVKNLLVFLPLLGAHELLNPPLLAQACWAFLAFSLCASSVYLVNDLVDIESDRRHPRKRLRPFAAGLISIPGGTGVALILLAAAFGVSLQVSSRAFLGWLGCYLAVTLCYTFWLKRKILVDSLVLAGLYTLRVLAGSAAVGIPSGFWLLAFSLFLFISLALVKRYTELTALMAEGRLRAAGRDYVVEDRHLIQTLGIVSGFSAVLMVALYINGESVANLYPNRDLLWPVVPTLLYWVTRIWLKAHRGEMDDDPIVFALTDRISLATIGVFFATLALASLW